VCLLSRHMTLVRARIEVAIPKKRAGSTGHSKAVLRFYDTLSAAILQHIDLDAVKVVIIASPGFVKEDFLEYLLEDATKKGLAVVLTNKSKFLLTHAHSASVRALKDVLAEPAVAAVLEDTKAAKETAALKDFFELMHKDADKAFYGYKHVRFAVDRGAVDTLLVTDGLFRAADLGTRKRYVALVEDTKEAGGEVLIFSSMHTSGEQLEQISGVAAALRFPLPDVEEQLEEEKADDDTSSTDSEEEEGEADGKGEGGHAASGAGGGSG
jgi:protein pelota